ncbi:Lipoprotein [Burkholderia pseudomallei]
MKKLVLVGLMGSAVLLAACGGGGDGSSGGATSGSSTGSTSQTASNTDAAFSCPADYKKLTLTNSSVVANVNMNLTTDDGIATLTIKTPSNGITGDFTVCLGKPNPTPAGVTADYIYEVKSSGDLRSMASSTLVLNFTTNVKPTQNPPVIEYANVSGGTVTYQSVLQGVSVSVAPNYSLSANAQVAGYYVVRLTK